MAAGWRGLDDVLNTPCTVQLWLCSGRPTGLEGPSFFLWGLSEQVSPPGPWAAPNAWHSAQLPFIC